MTAAGVTTTYLMDTANPTGLPQVLEEVVGGVVQRVYTYGTSRISQSQYLNNAWTTTFFGYDGQGSVRYLTDTTGAVTDRYTYDAFGNQLTSSGTTPNVYRYVGEPFDQALQLTYLRARYMSPASGRFLSMDSAEGNPFDPPSIHKYLYAGGDPTNRLDPLGLATMPQGTTAHIFIGMDFMAQGYFIHMFDRLSGTGAGRRCLRKILEQRFAFPGSGTFPDLVDFEQHFMFEIKPSGRESEGFAQLAQYLAIARTFDPRWREGTAADYLPFPAVPCDNTMTCIAFVDAPVGGVITYNEWDLRPTLLTIAVIATLGVMALALLAPYLTALTELWATMGAAAAAWAGASAAELALARQLAYQH